MDFGDTLRLRLRHAYLKFHRCAQLQLADSGVTADQFILLCFLAEHDGLKQKDLVELSGSDSSTIAAMVKILEKKGYISKVRDKSDGRAFQVRLTAKGKKKQQELTPKVKDLRDSLSAAISPEDQNAVLRALEQIDTVMSKTMKDKENKK